MKTYKGTLKIEFEMYSKNKKEAIKQFREHLEFYLNGGSSLQSIGDFNIRVLWMKMNKTNKDFIKKLSFVLGEKEEDVLNYLIKIGKEQHINLTAKAMKNKKV